jgi:hypothetical protein
MHTHTHTHTDKAHPQHTFGIDEGLAHLTLQCFHVDGRSTR